MPTEKRFFQTGRRKGWILVGSISPPVRYLLAGPPDKRLGVRISLQGWMGSEFSGSFLTLWTEVYWVKMSCRYLKEKSEKEAINNGDLRPVCQRWRRAAVNDSFCFCWGGGFFFWLPIEKKMGTIEKSFSLCRALHFPYLKEMLGLA